MQRLTAKFAVVTGGTRGIGRAIAERLLREGAAVSICGRKSEAVARAVEEMRPMGRVFGQAANVADYAQVKAFFQSTMKEFGRLDILVNNAGEGVFRKVAEMTVEDWHRNIDLNLNGPFYCAHEALGHFGTRGGFIVNISSLAGKNAFSGGAAYNASKAGLNRFTEALMLDHRYDNVRVCSIMPGSVDTQFGGDASKRTGDTGWMIAAEDVAETVANVLAMNERTMISAVEMRPSRPNK